MKFCTSQYTYMNGTHKRFRILRGFVAQIMATPAAANSPTVKKDVKFAKNNENKSGFNGKIGDSRGIR